mmetsp:Transcript_28702/g.48841  ORF Transcript_28702/g.48841 Transcript_28702/m.48841 type:complete len:218 (-) Transcript_28702:490-1143(-)
MTLGTDHVSLAPLQWKEQSTLKHFDQFMHPFWKGEGLTAACNAISRVRGLASYHHHYPPADCGRRSTKSNMSNPHARERRVSCGLEHRCHPHAEHPSDPVPSQNHILICHFPERHADTQHGVAPHPQPKARQTLSHGLSKLKKQHEQWRQSYAGDSARAGDEGPAPEPIQSHDALLTGPCRKHLLAAPSHRSISAFSVISTLQSGALALHRPKLGRR